MPSLRLDPELEARVRRAAALRGESLSEFLRAASRERADRTLSASSPISFDDVLGVVHGGGGRARRSGEAFAQALGEDRQR